MNAKPDLTPKPADKPTMLRFIDTFREWAHRDPLNAATPGLLYAALVMEGALPVDPLAVVERVRVDVDELLGRVVKPQATLRNTARP